MSTLKQIGKIQYRKPKPWQGVGLVGMWHVSSKIDGIRTFIDTSSNIVTSRNGKPLYNYPEKLIAQLKEETGGLKIIDCETYRDNWETTVALTRTKKESSWEVKRSDIYILTDDDMDRRLNRGYVQSPTKEQIKHELDNARAEGKEGIVLRQGTCWWKAKPTETFDVPITGFFEGKGKNVGTLGGFNTPMGRVGTGFFEKPWELLSAKEIRKFELLGYDKDTYESKLRSSLWVNRNDLIGCVIEVQCMELTNAGKFRHGTFVRLREDK